MHAFFEYAHYIIIIEIFNQYLLAQVRNTLAGRPLLNNISVSGIGFTTEASGPSLFISCTSPNIMPAMISWLDDTRPSTSAIGNNLRLISATQGIYQCLGQINAPDPSETDLTGELGNNIYVLERRKNLIDLYHL